MKLKPTNLLKSILNMLLQIRQTEYAGFRGSKDEVEAKEPAKEDTQYVVVEPEKGKRTISLVHSHISISSDTSSHHTTTLGSDNYEASTPEEEDDNDFILNFHPSSNIGYEASDTGFVIPEVRIN
ncbi:hypothetical protein RYX36_020657 [Vicia faba]